MDGLLIASDFLASPLLAIVTLGTKRFNALRSILFVTEGNLSGL
jgi:hypothetical protein